MYNDTWFARRGRHLLTLSLSAIGVGCGGVLAATVGALARMRVRVALAVGAVSAASVLAGVAGLLLAVGMEMDHADPPSWAAEDEATWE